MQIAIKEVKNYQVVGEKLPLPHTAETEHKHRWEGWERSGFISMRD